MFQNSYLSEYRLKGAKYMREIGSLPDRTKNEIVASLVSAI